MKILWSILKILIPIVLCFLIGYYLGSLKHKSDSKPNNQKPDTVYIDKPFVPEEPFDEPKEPEVIYVHTLDTIEILNIIYHNDTIKLLYPDSNFISVSPQFLSQFPNSSKLIQFLLTDTDLKLRLLNTDGKLFEKVYSIDTDKYSYNYFEDNMTQKRKSFIKRFSPLTELQWRPFNNLWDLNLGLKYNTSKFNYELGLNLFYYPRIKTNPGTDLYFKLSYQF